MSQSAKGTLELCPRKRKKRKLKGVTYTELRTVRLREDRKSSLEEPWLPEFWVMVKFLV